MPHNSQNKRHLVQVLMTGGRPATARVEPDNLTYVVAIATERATLEQRLSTRAREMFTAGVLDEATKLGETYGWESEAMTGNIYPLLKQMIDSKMSQEESIERIIIRDRQLAKRQAAWLKRHSFVQWKTLDEARVYLEDVLSR